MAEVEIETPGGGKFFRETEWEADRAGWRCTGEYHPLGRAARELRDTYPSAIQKEDGELVVRYASLWVKLGGGEPASGTGTPDVDRAQWLEWSVEDPLVEIDQALMEVEEEIERCRKRRKRLLDRRALVKCPFDPGDVVEEQTMHRQYVVQRVIDDAEEEWRLIGKVLYKTGFMADREEHITPRNVKLVKVGHREL